MPDNNNAGIHFIKYRPNYDNLRYYDRQAEEGLKKQEIEKQKLKNEQELTYECEIEDLKKRGYDLIDIYYTNLAHEAFAKGLYLMKALNDTELFMEKKGGPDNHPDKELYKMGLLADMLNLSADVLLADNRESIEDYFIKYVMDAMSNNEFEIQKYNPLDSESGQYVSIETLSSTTELYLSNEGQFYFIDASFSFNTRDKMHDRPRSKNCPGRLEVELVRTRRYDVAYAFDNAIRIAKMSENQ